MNTHIKKILALILVLTMVMPLYAFADNEEVQANEDEGVQSVEVEQTEDSSAASIWTAEDFVFEYKDLVETTEDGEDKSYPVPLSPATDSKNYLRETVLAVTGFSESGEEKLESNKDLVIPAEDASGTTVQAVWSNAFKDKGLTSLELPQGVVAENNMWDESVVTRGDFFILDLAFSGNELTTLTLPEGVIHIGMSAFKGNKLTSVSFPSTIMMISSQSFATNEISELLFTETTDFPLQLDAMAFGQNHLVEVYLPAKTSKVNKLTFYGNDGYESGKVLMHVLDPGEFVAESDYQMLQAEYSETPDDPDDPDDTENVTWTVNDFTFGEYIGQYGKGERLYGCDYSRDFTITGMAITGFSESGESKLEKSTDIVLPSADADGNKIMGVAQKAFYNKGLTSVKFPTGMLVGYDDTLTRTITKRGNFVIGSNAFAKNKLKEVYLPDGVIAVMTYAFAYNELEKVTLPKTIWWVETMSFANNQISKVNFPQTTYFSFEMHGWPFANNNIKSVRLPDMTKVVNKYSFQQNPGMEKLTDEQLRKAFSADGYAKLTEEEKANIGIVYMYTDNIDMEDLDRIHHIDQQTESTQSYFQKLIISSESGTQYDDPDAWNIGDFTLNGTVVTGLSESGIEKRKVNKDLIIPDYNASGKKITAIAAAPAGQTGGLFATADETFDTVTLPSGLKEVGDYAFREAGLTDVAFPPELERIGTAAFQMNKLTSVILPDTVTSVGQGAFASNKTLERIDLSSGLTEIAEGAFGCSDMTNWMSGLTEITIPEGITKIGDNAFAGNNFQKIIIPDGVREIGRFAFSTKNYLLTQQDDFCELRLPESLTSIGHRAFRNKNIAEVYLPEGVTELSENVFEKKLSTHGNPIDPGSEQYGLVTKVIVTNSAQASDKENFPDSDYHKIILIEDKDNWNSEDFTIEGQTVTGLSESGKNKLLASGSLTVVAEDANGDALTGIAASAFSGQRIEAVTISEGIKDIAESAFADNRISEVTFPESIATIGSSAFADNYISELHFPAETSTPLEIGERAFADNEIMSVQLPKGTAKVDGTVFIVNKGVKVISDGDDEENSGGLVLMYVHEPGDAIACVSNGDSKVQDLIADQDEPDRDAPWSADDFEYTSFGKTVSGFSYGGLIKLSVNKDVVIPEKSSSGAAVTEIADEAFAVDESAVDVGKYDYNSAYGIETLVLPATLKKIGKNAFIFNSLTTVNFDEATGLQSIGETAFKGNKLKKVHFTDSVTTVGEGAFSANNIVDIRLPKNSTFTKIPQAMFSMNIRMTTVDIPDTITEIGDMAFAGARLTSLKLPSSIVKIGRKAFHLHHLTSLTIPGSVAELGESAFEGTYKEQTLTKLNMGEGIRKIGKYAFKEGLLTSVKLPYTLEEMGTEPFLNNTGSGTDHVVTLLTENPEHLSFNDGAKTHVVEIDISADSVANLADKTYTGKAFTPKVVFKDSGRAVTDAGCEVTYQNNKAVGKATVTITTTLGTKKTVKKTFKILPKGTSISKIKAAKRGFTVKWKKQTKQTTGYQIQYSTSSKFKSGNKTVTISKNKVISKKVKKLKAKKKYYVRVRTFRKVGSAKYYSSWSKVKTVKTRK